MRKLLIGTVLTALIVGTGFLRDIVFVELNNSIAHAQSAGDAHDLMIAKYVLTFAFTLGYTILTALLVWFIYAKKELVLITVGCFGLLLLTALIVYGAGTVVSSSDTGHKMASSVMGLAQSPFPTMLLMAAFYYYNKKNESL